MSKLYLYRVDGVYVWAINWEQATKLVRDGGASANWRLSIREEV